MKILLINPLTKGGIAHYTACLANALSTKHGVILLTAYGKNEYELFEPKFKIYKLLIPPQANLFLKLMALIINHKIIFAVSLWCRIKNIHFQWPLSVKHDGFFIRMYKFFRFNVICTIHNTLPHEAQTNERELIKYKKYYSSFDRLIVHARCNKSDLIQLLKLTAEKIDVISHGNYLFFRNFSPELDKTSACKKLSLDPQYFYLLFFGYIRRYKGLDLALEALAKINHQNIKLIIAGQCNGSFDEYDQLIKKYHLTNSVIKFIQYIDNAQIANFYYASDIVIFPYRNIYQSGALQMALAFAKPVIASNTGGINETIDHNTTGILVEPENIDQLASAIDKLYSNHRLKEKIGRAGYSYAKEKLDWGKIASETEKLYK